MSVSPDVTCLTYRYDGTFEGFLCCVFESYTAHELPQTIIGPDDAAASLFTVKDIITVTAHADRVARSIPRRISPRADTLLRHAFLTCLPEKEIIMLRFLRQGYRYGARILEFAGNDDVWRLTKAVQHLLREAHLHLGFIRFTVQNGVLLSRIGPKNYILPLIASHFAARFSEERFLIYDERHHAALVYRPYETAIFPLDDFKASSPDASEKNFRALWQTFYDAIEIRPRHNEKCQLANLPKRYRRYMTEFTEKSIASSNRIKNPEP